MNENISKVSVPGGWPTAIVFVDVEPMTSNNIFQTHFQHGNSDSDQQVNDEFATFLVPSGCDGGRGSDVVEAADDAQPASRPRDGKSELNANSDITPHRGPIDSVPTPQNRVDEVNEATEGGPNHVHTRPHIPRLEMPPQGNDRENEADPGKYGERCV